MNRSIRGPSDGGRLDHILAKGRSSAALLSLAAFCLAACDIPVPVTVSDSFVLDIDEAIDQVDLGAKDPPICLPEDALASGVACEPCPNTSGELCHVTKLSSVRGSWPRADECEPLLPGGCPQIDEGFHFTALLPVDESDNPSLEASSGLVDDVIINRFAFDYEANETLRGLPEVVLWVGPHPDDAGSERLEPLRLQEQEREEFETTMADLGFVVLGHVPEQPPSMTGMVLVEVDPEGQKEMLRLLFEKKLSLIARVEGRLDTEADPIIPRGVANLRVMLRVTFFLSAA